MAKAIIGVHNAYFWGTGKENNLYNLIDFTAQAGLDSIELTPAKLLMRSKQERIDLGKYAAEKGLVVTCNGGLNPGCDVSSDYEFERERGIEFCKNALEAVHDVGGINWSGINYAMWLARPASTDIYSEKRRLIDNSVKSLHKILPLAEDLGIDYCFEVVNRYEQFMFNTAAEALDFVDMVDSPRAKLHLDIYHMSIDEDDMNDAIRLAGSRGKLGHMHVGERNRRVTGTAKTHTDWAGVCKALNDVDYQGVMTIESFVLTASPICLKTCTWVDREHSAKNIDGLIDDLRIGGEFLRKCMAENK